MNLRVEVRHRADDADADMLGYVFRDDTATVCEAGGPGGRLTNGGSAVNGVALRVVEERHRGRRGREGGGPTGKAWRRGVLVGTRTTVETAER